MADFRTIKGYQTQWRPYGAGAWRIVRQFDNPCMTSALDSMAHVMRMHGDGYFRIVKVFTDDSSSVRFFAAFGDSAEANHGVQV